MPLTIVVPKDPFTSTSPAEIYLTASGGAAIKAFFISDTAANPPTIALEVDNPEEPQAGPCKLGPGTHHCRLSVSAVDLGKGAGGSYKVSLTVNGTEAGYAKGNTEKPLAVEGDNRNFTLIVE